MSVTAAGYIRRAFEEILAELSDGAITLFGEGIDLTVTTPEGALVQLMALGADLLEGRAEEVYNSGKVSAAFGVSLDRIVAIAGLTRQPPRFATVSATLTGDALSPFTAGLQVGTTQAVVFQVVEAGALSAGGVASVIVRAVVAGQTGNVIAGAISQIVTPEPGITTVTNPLKSDGGFPIETDPELFARFVSTRAVSGGSIPSKLTGLDNNPDVIAASILENQTDFTDENGLPPHSTEAIVTGGVPAEFGLILLERNTGGMETFGTSSVTVQDNRGEDRVIRYSVPSELDIFVTLNITINSKWQTANEASALRNVIRLIGGTDLTPASPVVFSGVLGAGENVIGQKISGVMYGSGSEIYESLEGVENIEVLLSKTVTPTLPDTINVLPRENSIIDSDKIIVNVL